MINGSKGILRLRCSAALSAGQWIAKHIGITGANDTPAARQFAEQITLAHLLTENAIYPGQDVRRLERLDGLADSIAATPSLLGNRFITWKAEATAAVVEAPEQRFEYFDIGPGKGASVLARLAVLRGPRLSEDHDANLRVAIKRDAWGWTEHLLAMPAYV